MNKIMNKIMITIMGVLAIAGNVLAEQGGVITVNAEDTAPSMRIMYNGTGQTNFHASFLSTTVTVTLTEGVVSSNITLVLSKSWTNILNEIGTFTNASGKSNWKAELLNGELTDTLSNKVIAVSLTDMTDGKWHEVMKYDTSVSLTFDTCKSKDLGGYLVKSIWGEPTGTGNITLQAWIDGTEVFKKTQVSPTYIASSTGSNDQANVIHFMRENMNVYVGKNQRFHARFTRATTATTGTIGIETEVK